MKDICIHLLSIADVDPQCIWVWTGRTVFPTITVGIAQEDITHTVIAASGNFVSLGYNWT